MTKMLKLLALVVCTVLVPHLVLAELTADHFNYGGGALQLVGCQGGTGLDGGENWGSYWAGYCGLSPSYDPTAGLSYSQSCYWNGLWRTHEGNDPNSGGPVFQSYRPAWRKLPHKLAGVVWMSALVRLGATGGYVIFGDGGDNGPGSFFFGIWNNGYASVQFTNNGTVQGPRKLELNRTYLLLSKLEFNYDGQNHERITLWIDIGTLNTCLGEAGLGTPEVSFEGVDANSGWEWFSLDMANSRTDAFRLSHGPGANLGAVVYEPPHEPPSPVQPVSWGQVKHLFR